MIRLAKRSFEGVPVDIAPLIDVVFQLLLFFMLTSSFVLYPGIRVALPRADTAKTLSVSSLVVTLTKDHVLYWDEEAVSLKELRKKLKQAGGSKPVLIRADRHAYVDKLVELWDLCRDAGYQEIHIATLSE
ncbi:MAG: biopolymer transporter ExbD [Candidatus Omnitrophica bacterium]|nr:biopolymer transporter ExbD [Candidatus Omnitrophota bacterium]